MYGKRLLSFNNVPNNGLSRLLGEVKLEQRDLRVAMVMIKAMNPETKGS